MFILLLKRIILSKSNSLNQSNWTWGLEGPCSVVIGDLSHPIYLSARWELARPRYRKSTLRYMVLWFSWFSDAFFHSLTSAGQQKVLVGNWKDKTARKPVNQFHFQLFFSVRRWRMEFLSHVAEGWWIVDCKSKKKRKLTNPQITVTLKASLLLHGQFHNWAMNDPKSP